MASHVTDLASRIMAMELTPRDDHRWSRVALMREYLRRSAWWAVATSTEWHKFFDIAEAVDPSIRADPHAVADVVAYLAKCRVGGLVEQVCTYALNFAALLDADVPLPAAPADPYEPLMILLERGDGFFSEGAGTIDVDMAGVRVGTMAENLREEPVVNLDPVTLDAIDAGASGG